MKETGQSVQLTAAASDFRRLLAHYDDTSVSITVVKRKAIPEWVKASYRAQWQTPPTPPSSGEVPSAVRKARRGRGLTCVPAGIDVKRKREDGDGAHDHLPLEDGGMAAEPKAPKL